MTKSTRKVALLSGASRGIGAAIAANLLAHGWAVSLGCRTPSEVEISDGDNQLVSHFDALDASTEQAWIDATLAKFGRIDALIHNAGIMLPVSVLEASDAEFDRTFNVNVKSPMRMSRLAWPHLQASGSGRIVMMSSLSGKRVKGEHSTLYAMSKYAALALAHSLRKIGDNSGIRCTAICPGFVATDMGTALTEVPAEKMTQPEDLAHLIRTVLELPNNASIAEIPVNWTVEDNY
ncbi:SDR family NAD(P)-dependent oxidoreductase [Candidatus Pantoea multigeneris]|uniref:SDR family NAD(P)-dependent oxidoreductase n=1 Tax=Candidatus Pantoea multigeneris TaxID=2608357 RepID=A0ABX0R684_9GAMM|nr:SDR family NAD(P)-dependent oxidoreductase [Pantoea multigeneris]NIF20916.1 SDR family NAD(P)-dependent oxidoreductase [Pantoea multigeneris]